jgi:hypothetical protein
MKSKASSKYCLRFWCPESEAGSCLYVIPHASWYPGRWEVTFRTRVTPRDFRVLRSAASCWLPR